MVSGVPCPKDRFFDPGSRLDPKKTDSYGHQDSHQGLT